MLASLIQSMCVLNLATKLKDKEHYSEKLLREETFWASNIVVVLHKQTQMDTKTKFRFKTTENFLEVSILN